MPQNESAIPEAVPLAADPGEVFGADPPIRRPPLRARAVSASLWTLGGYFGSQGLRLVSNVILARLLFPEAFGLMTLVTVFMQGLQMFSDVGVLPSIVHDPRGEEPDYLNTAWTIQSMRGVALWVCACIGAIPFANFYGEPLLRWLIPVSGLSALVAGFTSTAVPLLNRRLSLRDITMWEVGSQIVSIVVMVTWALIWRAQGGTGLSGVWALVAGGMASAAFRMVTSHLLVPGHHNRFRWDPTAARSLFRFGRWIFVSTALTFFALQLDKLMLGKMLTTGDLGVYNIAMTFATLGLLLARKVGGRVLFPALAEINRERPEALYSRMRQGRLALIGISTAVLVPLSLGAPLLIDLLYDPRYAAAGWMLQYLAAGAIVGVVSTSAQHVFLALGHTFKIIVLLVCQISVLVGGALLGHHFFGTEGLVVGVALVELLNYPVLVLLLRRLGLWQPELDAPFIALAIVVAVVGRLVW